MEILFDDFGWKVTMEEAPLPDGRVKKVARAHRADSIQIIAHVGDEKILLLREYRPYYGAYIWMLPGGRADKEMDITEAAQRELREETGFKAERLELLWTSNLSESLVSSNHLFEAHDLTKAPLPQDDDELMEVHEVEITEALARIEASPKVHLPSAYALRRFIDHGSTGSP